MKNLKVNVILSLVALSLAALVLPQPAAGASADYIYRTILPTGYQSASFESLNGVSSATYLPVSSRSSNPMAGSGQQPPLSTNQAWWWGAAWMAAPL
jgi:hypothetical protein